MARTHTAGGGGKKGRGAGLRLVLGVCRSTASAWTTTASKAIAQLLQAVMVYALWARTRPSPSRPGHGEEFQSIALVCLERPIGYERSLKCVTALERRSDASPAVRSGMAPLRACACAAERRSRIPCVAARNAQVQVPAGRRPSCAWERHADGVLGRRCEWYRPSGSVGVVKPKGYSLHRARGSSPASRFGYHAQRLSSTPSIQRGRRTRKLEVAP